jgi:homoserine acetyltransferase
MQSYKKYCDKKLAVARALEHLSYLGKEQRTTRPAKGYLSDLRVTATIHYQPTDGATNYHTDATLDAALSKAARKLFPQIRELAEQIMADELRSHLAACRGELEAALAQIEADDIAATLGIAPDGKLLPEDEPVMCDDCGEFEATEGWGDDSPYPVPVAWLCESCADKRRDHAVERAIEEA